MVSHLGKSNFPQPADIDKAYVDRLHPSVLEEFRGYVELCLEHTLNAHTLREKAHAQHVESLVKHTSERIKGITEA